MTKKVRILVIIFIIVILFVAVCETCKIVFPGVLMNQIGFKNKRIIECENDNYFCLEYYPDYKYSGGSRYIAVKRKFGPVNYTCDFLRIDGTAFPSYMDEDVLPFSTQKEDNKFIKEGCATRITLDYALDLLEVYDSQPTYKYDWEVDWE